jgi:hypothetical protein
MHAPVNPNKQQKSQTSLSLPAPVLAPFPALSSSKVDIFDRYNHGNTWWARNVRSILLRCNREVQKKVGRGTTRRRLNRWLLHKTCGGVGAKKKPKLRIYMFGGKRQKVRGQRGEKGGEQRVEENTTQMRTRCKAGLCARVRSTQALATVRVLNTNKIQ